MFECSTAFIKATQIKRDESDSQSLIQISVAGLTLQEMPTKS